MSTRTPGIEKKFFYKKKTLMSEKIRSRRVGLEIALLRGTRAPMEVAQRTLPVWMTNPEPCLVTQSAGEELRASLTLLLRRITSPLVVVDMNLEHCPYPFHPPRLWLRRRDGTRIEYPSRSLVLPIPARFDRYIEPFRTCACCHSVLNNWSASRGISEVLREIRLFIEQNRALSDLVLAEKVMEARLGFCLPQVYEFLGFDAEAS